MWRADEQSSQTEEKRESGQAVRKKQGKKERIAGRLLILLVAWKKKEKLPAHAQTVNITVTSKPRGRCVCVFSVCVCFGQMGIGNACVNSMPVERKAKTMFVQYVFV